MAITQQKIILSLQVLFQLLFLILITLPAMQTVHSFNGISNWTLLILQLLFQLILNLVFFLLSRQKVLSLIQSPLTLLAGEIVLILIIGMHLYLDRSNISGQLLIVQWLLLHTSLFSNIWFSLNTSIVFAGQIIIYQKIIEMTQTQVLWEIDVIFYFLCYLGLLTVVKALLFDVKVKTSHNQIMFVLGIIIFVTAGIYGFMFTQLANSQIIWQLMIAIILMAISFVQYTQYRLAKKQKAQLQN